MTVYRTELPPNAVLPERSPNAPAPGEALPAHYSRCFGCGDGEPRGLHMKVFAGEGLTLTATFDVTAHHQGAPGLAHGGLLACAFDEALGMLGHLTRMSQVTVRLETDFRRPVPVGTTLFISARVEGVAGRKTYMSADGRLDAADGPVAVRARALFVSVGVEHFVQHGRREDIQAVVEDPSLVNRGDYTVNP